MTRVDRNSRPVRSAMRIRTNGKNKRTQRTAAPEEPAMIIRKLLGGPIDISEQGVSRSGTVIEAIVLQLWRAMLAGNIKAYVIWNQYQKLMPTAETRGVEVVFSESQPS